MRSITYRNRRAFQIENDAVRLTVLEEGGHIAEMLDKASGVNPLWTPPWPSIEPSAYEQGSYPEYGDNAESKLLAGIMGHNLCMDIFGGPSADEAEAGLTVHGEASVVRYVIEGGDCDMSATAELVQADLRFERRLSLAGREMRFVERVENLSACDRPIAWTQHVTLGPPFLEKGLTEFEASATRSMTFPGEFGDVFPEGVVFDWPHAPRHGGGTVDLRKYTDAPSSAGFSTHLMDPSRERASFRAFSPRHSLAFGYEWNRADFPWLGIWDENHSRKGPPWNGNTLARGMEFGASPFPEPRRRMIERNGLFGERGYRWIPARSRVSVEYRAFFEQSSS